MLIMTVGFQSPLFADNYPPVADAGPDRRIVDTRADGMGRETVKLDGSQSVSPSGSALYCQWFEGGLVIAGGCQALTTLVRYGIHTLVLVVTDEEGLSDSDAVNYELIRRLPITPASISAEPVPGEG